MRTRKLILFATLIAFTVILACAVSSCAKFQNEIAADGGLVGSYNGCYVVRNDSGGRIMDVWVLPDSIVQAEHSGSGWLFRDTHGDVIHLGGDVRVMRLHDSDLSKWHEYHAEFETKTYQELYVTKSP